MFNWIRNKWAKRRMETQWIAEVQAEFRNKYPGRKAITTSTRIIYQVDMVVIVQICFADGRKPPPRSWWRLDNAKDWEELSLEKVEVYRPLPEWR